MSEEHDSTEPLTNPELFDLYVGHIAFLGCQGPELWNVPVRPKQSLHAAWDSAGPEPAAAPAEDLWTLSLPGFPSHSMQPRPLRRAGLFFPATIAAGGLFAGGRYRRATHGKASL